jgi:hypothetical protein
MFVRKFKKLGPTDKSSHDMQNNMTDRNLLANLYMTPNSLLYDFQSYKADVPHFHVCSADLQKKRVVYILHR